MKQHTTLVSKEDRTVATQGAANETGGGSSSWWTEGAGTSLDWRRPGWDSHFSSEFTYLRDCVALGFIELVSSPSGALFLCLWNADGNIRSLTGQVFAACPLRVLGTKWGHTRCPIWHRASVQHTHRCMVPSDNLRASTLHPAPGTVGQGSQKHSHYAKLRLFFTLHPYLWMIFLFLS